MRDERLGAGVLESAENDGGWAGLEERRRLGRYLCRGWSQICEGYLRGGRFGLLRGIYRRHPRELRESLG